MVAGPGRTLIDVQLTVGTLETRHAVALEAVGIWSLGHTQGAVLAGLGGTALGLHGPTGVAITLRCLTLGPWST